MTRLTSFRALLYRLILATAAGGVALAQELKITPEMLQTWLKQFPQADADKNGELSEAEARAYYASMRAAEVAKNEAAAARAPAPTIADLKYGPHARNVLDFWQAKADGPAPVVIYIHGGGFVAGDKTMVRQGRLIRQCLDAGVSLVAINYRFLAPNVPLQDILRDCARAVQFVRAKSVELRIDKTRIAGFGSSAGAGSSLWLAFHDDMADPQNADPVLRESTRLTCAAVFDTQFTYDLPQWANRFGEDNRRRFGGIYNSPGIYGLGTDEELKGPVGLKLRAECDFFAMISADDPPVYIRSGLPTMDLNDVNQYLHHPRHAQLVFTRCLEVGVPVVAKITALKITPPAAGPEHGEEFVFKHLKATKPAAAGLQPTPNR